MEWILGVVGYLIIWGMICYKRQARLNWKEVLIIVLLMALSGALISLKP